jgi:alpha-L-rhamnosidase
MNRYLLLLCLLIPATVFAANPRAPFDLRVCDKSNPTGTSDRPYFGWLVDDPDDNEIQSAFEILVASSAANLSANKGDVWTSGKIASRKQNYVFYGGPVLDPGKRYFWKVRTWDRSGGLGPFSASAWFDTGLFTATDWQPAKWIRRNTADADDYSYYRKTVPASAKKVARATIYAAACHNYELYLNGGLVGKGSSHHYPQYAYYQAFDVTRFIKPGKPVTVAALTHWYGGGQGRAAGSRGFLAKLVITYTDGTRSVTGSDETWKVTRAAQWKTGQPRRNGEGIGYVDLIDSRIQQNGWNNASFDDRSWTAATVIGDPPAAPWVNAPRADLTRVIEREISPVSVKQLGNNSYLIDLGRIYAGVPLINFSGGRAGDTVKIRGAYLLDSNGTASLRKGNQGTNLNYVYINNGTRGVFKPMVYLAYRYLQVDNAPNTLTAANVRFVARHFELDESRADFSSSSTMLNRVWQLMTRSLIAGAQEDFVDTPTREKGAFLGDGSYQGPPAMTVMGERGMNLRSLLQFLDSQDQYWPDGRLNAVYPNVDGKRDIPDYTQMYLIWAWDYYLQTGNTGFLESVYPKLRKIADYVAAYRNPATGLIHNLAGGSGPYQYGIIDWPRTMRYGYDMETESRTVIDALAYLDFSIMSKIAAATGNTADSVRYAEQANAIRQAINSRLLDKNGVYIDGLKSDGSQSAHASQHANMFPFALGMVPDQHRAAVIGLIKARKMNVGMVTVRWLPEALGQAGEGPHLLELYTNPQWDGWAQTLSKGGTLTWEAWDADETDESLSHPWGAVGLTGIQEYIVGLKSLKPQHELVQVKPLDFGVGLRHAAGSFPGDRGTIRVSWTSMPERYELKLVIPDNVTANVYIPKGPGNNSSITMNGKAVSGKIEGDYIFLGAVGSGNYTLTRAR